MKTIQDIDREFGEELEKLQKRYREALEELIRENGMDKRVIRLQDEKEGVLIAERDFYRVMGYELKFYPITKAGKVSKKPSGFSFGFFKKGIKAKEKADSRQTVRFVLKKCACTRVCV